MDGSLDFSVSGDTFPGGRTPAKVVKLVQGASIEARYGGEGEWFPGKVEAVNGDGTYNVAYADGDRESHVVAELMRLVAPKTPTLRRQDTEESQLSTQKLKRAASEVEDKEKADAKGAASALKSAAKELESSHAEAASKGMKKAADELEDRKQLEAQGEVRKAAERERNKAPERVKEAAHAVGGAKLATAVKDLGGRARAFDSDEDERRRLPSKVEPRSWSGLTTQASPALQAALPWEPCKGFRPEVALLAERSLRRDKRGQTISRQQRVLLARSVDFSSKPRKLNAKLSQTSAHRLSRTSGPPTDRYGRTVKDVTNARDKRIFKYGNRDDALNCTFRPKLGKGDPLGEEKTNEDEEPVENNFIQRQDAWGRKVRQQKEHAAGEKDYAAVIDKKMCPSCGAVQKYDEILNKRDRCPECAIAYKTQGACKMARERELLGPVRDAETCDKCGAQQTLEELLDTRDTCPVCAIVYEDLVCGCGDESEEESDVESEKEEVDLEQHVGKSVKTPSGKQGKISRVEGEVCYVVLDKEASPKKSEADAEAKEDSSPKKKKGSDDEGEAKGSDNDDDASPRKKKHNSDSDASPKKRKGFDDEGDEENDAEKWMKEKWPLMGRKGKNSEPAGPGEDEFYLDELQFVDDAKTKKKKKGSDGGYSSDEDQDGSDAEAKSNDSDDGAAEAKGDGSPKKKKKGSRGKGSDDDDDASPKKKKDKKKKKTRRAPRKTGPRTFFGKLRAKERTQMTLEALELREQSIKAAEASLLHVELRKLTRSRKLQRAAARRLNGKTSGDVQDADEKAIAKALDDEKRAAKALSVYEPDATKRSILEANATDARKRRNAAFVRAVPSLKDRLQYNQTCLDKVRRWRAKLAEKPEVFEEEKAEDAFQAKLQQKLAAKGLGTFTQRLEHTLVQGETPELLERRQRTITQFQKELEAREKRKVLLTKKALRQKNNESKDGSESETEDTAVAHRVEADLEKMTAHMGTLRDKIKEVQGGIEARRGDVAARQRKRFQDYAPKPMKKVYDPQTEETVEVPLFDADEGAFDNFIERREATLLKGETRAALELWEQSLRKFEADLRKRTAKKVRAERKRERAEERKEAGSDAEESADEENEDDLQHAVEDALQDKLPDIEERLAGIEARKEELMELEAEAEAKTRPTPPTKKAFVNGRVKDVPLYNPNKKAYVNPPQGAYLGFMSRQTEVVERATNAQTLKLRETALVRREKEMKKKKDMRRKAKDEREERERQQEDRQARKEEREEKEEERRERLVELHEQNAEKRAERAERAKEARDRRKRAFLRANDEDDDELDAIEQEIEGLETALEDMADERQKAEDLRRDAEEDEKERAEAMSPVKNKTKRAHVNPPDGEWADFLGRREEALERRTTRDSLALREKTLTTYELEITRRKEGKEQEITARGKRQHALEARRDKLEKKRAQAEELRDKCLARHEEQTKKRLAKAERAAAAIERRKERGGEDSDSDDDGSLADVKDEIDELDRALEDIRAEREKARATRKAKIKEERRIEDEMHKKAQAAQTERVDARRRRREEKKRAERQRRRGSRDESESGSDRRRRDDSRSDSD